MTDYVAGSPYENCTPGAAAQFLAAAAADGLEGGVLYACPDGVAGEVDQLTPQSDWATVGLTQNMQFDILVAFPGKTSMYNVALCILFMFRYNWTAQQCCP